MVSVVNSITCEYPCKKEKLSVTSDNPHILQSDHGSYWFLGSDHNTSAYNGLGFLDLSSYTLTSVLFDVRVQGATVSKVVVRPQESVRITDKGKERFFFRDRLACYAFSGSETTEFLLDVRDNYDFSLFERDHSWEVISKHPWTVRVKNKNKSFVFVCSKPLSLVQGEWKQTRTAFDARRSGRGEWWSELFARADGDVRVVIAPEHRLHEASQVLLDEHVWEPSSLVWEQGVQSIALSSVESLLTQTPNGAAGILAGLPWFFQIYTRDEAIAAGALIAAGKYKLAGRILLREISVILPDGRIPNRFPHSQKGSADGVGWAFFRLDQLYTKAKSALSNEQWTFVSEQLKTALARLDTGCDGVLIESAAQETWMDTTGGVGDDRVGARVEVQALTLRMLRFCACLCEELQDGNADRFRLREQQLLRITRKRLFKDDTLFDGCVHEVPDKTIRPNALLARYIYPWMLSDDEWRKAIDFLLERLTTDWGGLATINPSHELFVDMHTGEDDRSYHRGDAWFFVNNLVATALVEFDEKYRVFAERVHDASVHDLLSLGAAGHSSEISNARVQEALGCWCQAWSASSLVELSLALRR